MTLANFVAYMAQIAVIVLVCAGAPRLLGLRSPVVQYTFWRCVLLLCLALPLIQPWNAVIATSAPALAAAVAPETRVTNGVASIPAAPPIDVLSFDPSRAVLIALVAGAALRLLWLAAGIVRLRALRRAPGTEAAEGFDDLRAAIGTETPVLWSPHVRHAVTFGVRRPVVLLPVALKAVDRGAQRAVVAHELHHVARRDWGWLIGEEILRAVFWFHPAMWWLVSRVQLARETVVDELSILVTNARRTYLDALLSFADDSGISPSSAFSARRHLFHRVMLLSKEGEMSSLRIAVGSGLLVLALGAGSWGATHAFPLYDTAQPAKAPATGEVARSYAPPKKDAIADMKRTSPQRVAEHHSAGPQRATPPPPPPPPPPQDSAAAPMSEQFQRLIEVYRPIRVGGDIKAPAKIRDVKPAYPPDARADGVTGVVVSELLIGPDGNVVDARILRGVPMLDDAALDALRQWRFTPTLLNGEPQSVLVAVTISFMLQ